MPTARLSAEQADAELQRVFALPEAAQRAEWRKWAASSTSEPLRAEALKQLAWARDPQAVALAQQALDTSDASMGIVAATVLSELGLPMAAPARERLFTALRSADSGAKGPIAWALVVLGDARVVGEVVELHRSGAFSGVQRLDGGAAFDLRKLAPLISVDALTLLARSDDSKKRRLAAGLLGHRPEPSWTADLIRLAGDPDVEVARNAAAGLARSSDSKAHAALIERMKRLGPHDYERFLGALRDEAGTEALLFALGSVSASRKDLAWQQTSQIFDLIYDPRAGNQGLNDPRAGTALYAFATNQRHAHWQWRAAVALAAIGDLRAVPLLAQRLRKQASDIYSDATAWEAELKNDDSGRAISARLLADLAAIHPDQRGLIAQQAEDSLLAWLGELPSPHPNGFRALAAMQSMKGLRLLRKWANVKVPLPAEGAQPPIREEFVIAQSALRYVGQMKDAASWSLLEQALRRRSADRAEYDVTMEGLMQGGVALLGMSLRALGVGAADGFSEWGDRRAFRPLLDHVADANNNEQSRYSACAGLAWVAAQDDFIEVMKRIQEYGSASKSDRIRRACLLETLLQKPVPGTAPALLELMTQPSAQETRPMLARALAKGGFDSAVKAKLFALMRDEASMTAAALALVLGAPAQAAARAVALFADKPETALEELSKLWGESFSYVSMADLESGLIFKYVDNADAIARVRLRMARQAWARLGLSRQLDHIVFDNGPHSPTRIVLRQRLLQTARAAAEDHQRSALRTLSLMRERGVLLALREEPGALGRMAHEAYFGMLNPAPARE